MRLMLDKNYENSYICEIEENSGIIRWQYEKNNRPDYILIVQSPYASLIDIAEIIKTINDSNIKITIDRIIPITSDISCKLTTVSQGMRGVYNVNVMPANYSVYGCKNENGVLTVFDEENKSHNQCKVSAIIEYKVEETPISVRQGNFLHRTETKYNFSKITIFDNKSYEDGVLYYTFEDCDIKFPIGKQMLEHPFFVRWFNNSKPPLIRSDLDGYKYRKR